MSAISWTRTGPSGEDFLLGVPRLTNNPKPAIIFFPQSGGQAEFFQDVTSGDKIERAKIFQRFSRDGFVCASSDFGGANTMGNDNATGRVKQVYDFLQTVPGVKPGPVFCFGTSMGNATALSFARRYPGTVKGIISIFGLSDAQPYYMDDLGGFRDEFEAAWGITYPAPLPTNANPMLYLPSLAGIPWRGWYSTDDGLVPPVQGQAFATALNAVAGNAGMAVAKEVAVGGHSDAIFSSISYSDEMLAFYNSLS